MVIGHQTLGDELTMQYMNDVLQNCTLDCYVINQCYANKFNLKRRMNRTSGQDGGITRYTSPLHKTKRRKTASLKAKQQQQQNRTAR